MKVKIGVNKTIFEVVRFIGKDKYLKLSDHDTEEEAIKEIEVLESIGHFKEDLGIIKVTTEKIHIRDIVQCPWCGRYNRFTKSAPPNARYCPPRKGQSKQQSCSARFASFKFKQRRSWNDFLRKTYEDEQKIAEAWGISNLKDYEWWDETVKDPVLHPNDMVERHALTPQAKDDYESWKKTLHQSNPRHKLVLNDEKIRKEQT